MAMCIYQNCTNVQKPFCSLAFFSLPKDHRRQLWIENSGNSELANLSETARRVVCQKHFSPRSLRIQFHRTTLSRDAVPERWDADRYSSFDLSVVEPIEISENDDIDDDPQSHDKILPNDDEYAEANCYENYPADDAEGIELVEIDLEENSHTDEYVVDNIDMKNEIDQQTTDEEIIVLEELPNRSTTFCNDARIEEADVTTKKSPYVPVDIPTAKIVKQCSNKPPDELMELSDNEIVRHNSVAPSDMVTSSTGSKSNDSLSGSVDITNEEDKYFALALAGILQRISPQKKAFAKVNILRYLTELEYGKEATIN